MVSFWPWKGDSSSTASFEKTLSAISIKISATQARLDAVRQASRRRKVVSAFMLLSLYLFYTVVIFVVLGASNTGPWEWAGLAGGPVVIYVVRTSISAIDNYRIDSLSARLKEQQAQRATTIQKLKDATKYDSTLQLIEKYGGEKKDNKDHENRDAQSNNAGRQQGRKTGKPNAQPNRLPFNPGPTANIQRARPPPNSTDLPPTAEFAPNAESLHPRPSSQQGLAHQNQPHQPYPSPPQPPSQLPPQPESHWYDRIFDALLGEDETLPKNRIVLLCSRCRLVNGQAPPGTQSLADVGVWRCMGCGGQNGETKEDEGRRAVREALRESSREGKDEEMAEMETKASKEEANEEQEEAGEAGLEGHQQGKEPTEAIRRRPGKGPE